MLSVIVLVVLYLLVSLLLLVPAALLFPTEDPAAHETLREH